MRTTHPNIIITSKSPHASQRLRRHLVRREDDTVHRERPHHRYPEPAVQRPPSVPSDDVRPDADHAPLARRQSCGSDCIRVLIRSRGYTIAQESVPDSPPAAIDARSSSRHRLPPVAFAVVAAAEEMPSSSPSSPRRRRRRRRDGRSADLVASYEPKYATNPGHCLATVAPRPRYNPATP